MQLADSPGDLQKVVTRALEANVQSICSFSEHYKVTTPVMAGAIFQPVRNEDAFPPKDPREDGAGFLGYGLVDVALGWSLRYRNFPAEIIETMNLDPLGKIVEIDRAGELVDWKCILFGEYPSCRICAADSASI